VLLTTSFAICKLGLAVGLGFFLLSVHSIIPYLRQFPTDVSFENCITTPLMFSIDYNGNCTEQR